MELASERYVALTTFTGTGTAKRTPVWPVDAGDGRVGFVTSSDTWKIKRIRNDQRVTLQPSNAKGTVRDGSREICGIAEVVVGARFDELRSKVKAKYGYQLRVIELLHAIPGSRTGHPNDCAVIITLDEA